MDARAKYEIFLKVFIEANPSLIKSDQYSKAQDLWNKVKGDEEELNSTLLHLKSRASLVKSRNIKSFFKTSNKTENTKSKSCEKRAEVATAIVSSTILLDDECRREDTAGGSHTISSASRDKPAQERLMENISSMNSQLSAMIQVRSSGLGLDVDTNAIKKMKMEISSKEMKLKRLQNEAERQRNRRAAMKQNIDKVCQENRHAATLLKSFSRGKSGRPFVEEDQPELLSAIVKIVEASAATDDRRRSEILRTVKTLDDLCEKLMEMGFCLSRSSTYLRLLPRRSDSREGKRHVQTVPLKLLRPENTLRKRNVDRMFAKSVMDDMHEICKLFGPSAILYLSNDDTARVPLGLAAAPLQSPILMHLDYKVGLPDHNFVVAQRHKLIPSVYGVCEVQDNGNLSYSGDTFIRIRSGKHDKSNSYTHAYDMLELFKRKLITVKPILLLTTDGASDEAPRYPKPLASAVYFFKELNLDVFLHGVNAAGLSLSHDVAGVILPHNTYGNHLDNNGKTIDEDLEKKNFFKAAETLSEIWSNTIIDGYPVECKAVPLNKEFVPPQPSAMWVSKHVRQTRYSLQIVKCLNKECCTPFATNWLSVFPGRFPPFPAVHRYGVTGIEAVEPLEYFRDGKLEFSSLQQRLLVKVKPVAAEEFEQIPFDLYCPSMHEKLKNGICEECDSYWPSKAAKDRHRECHKEENGSKISSDASSSDEEMAEKDGDKDQGSLSAEHQIPMPIFKNISEILQGPFTDF